MDIRAGTQAAKEPHSIGFEAGDSRIPRDDVQPAKVQAWLLASLIIAVPTTLALAIQLSTYPNHDVAWVLWGAREMMHGAIYGRDIIEPNPPLAWYLSMPTNALATALGVPLDIPFRLALMVGGVASALSLVRFRPAEWIFSGRQSWRPSESRSC